MVAFILVLLVLVVLLSGGSLSARHRSGRHAMSGGPRDRTPPSSIRTYHMTPDQTWLAPGAEAAATRTARLTRGEALTCV